MSEIICRGCGSQYTVREKAEFVINGGDADRCVICLEDNRTINLAEGKENRKAGQPGDWQKEVEE